MISDNGLIFLGHPVYREVLRQSHKAKSSITWAKYAVTR